MSLYLEDCKKIITIVTIRDYSVEGFALQIENISGLSNGQIVCLRGTSPTEPFEANYIIDHYLKNKRFMIMRVENGLQPIVGVQTITEAERVCKSN